MALERAQQTWATCFHQQLPRVWENAMPFIPVLNSVKVVLEHTKRGQLVVNVYHVSKSSPIITADLAGIAAIFFDWFDTSIKELTVDTMTLDRIVVTDLSVENGEQYIEVISPPLAGTATGSDLPNNAAMVVKHLSLQTGRSYRGRTYVAGLGEDYVGGDLPLTTTVADYGVAYQDLWDLLDGAGYFHSIVSYVEDGEPRVNGLVSPVIAYDNDGVMDSQRRRLTGRGA